MIYDPPPWAPPLMLSPTFHSHDAYGFMLFHDDSAGAAGAGGSVPGSPFAGLAKYTQEVWPHLLPLPCTSAL